MSQYENEQAKTQVLQDIVVERLDELFPELGVKLNRTQKMYFGLCPVHGSSSNHGALNLYHTGHTVAGYWKCNTHHCEKIFKPTIVGLVRGILSHQIHGWEREGDKTVSFYEAIKWLCKFINQEWTGLKVDLVEMEKRRYAAQIHQLNKQLQRDQNGITRDKVRKHLDIPAAFFLERGYSKEILDEYDVGLYRYPDKPLSNRVAVPIYDDNWKLAVGFTGRTIWGRCEVCDRFHPSKTDCPTDPLIKRNASKWRNSPIEFTTHSFLYNFWKAKEHIKRTGVAIIVEGPPDIWRLEEAGVTNAVALFGCSLSDEQSIILERSGALSLVLLLDNDESGRLGVKTLQESLSRSYNVVIGEYSAKDVGEMGIEEVNRQIKPTIRKVMQ